MEEKIVRILETADLSGFTELLQWDSIKRYVVALTDNLYRTPALLAAQAEFYGKFFNNLTIWWRFDPERKAVLVDIGTSTDCLEEARRLKRLYNQRSFRDTVEKRNIS